jgi:hypothetical protein
MTNVESAERPADRAQRIARGLRTAAARAGVAAKARVGRSATRALTVRLLVDGRLLYEHAVGRATRVDVAVAKGADLLREAATRARAA